MKWIATKRIGATVFRGVLLVMLLVGCSAKKPYPEKITGCVVERTWHDEQGKERKDCVCRNKHQIGIDARTGARIYKCE